MSEIINLSPSSLVLFGDGWVAPSAAEVRLVIQQIGVSQNKAASLVGVDPRSLRRWVLGEVAITYAPWRLLLLHAGLASVPGPEKK